MVESTHKMDIEKEKKYPTIGDYILVKTLGSGYNSKVKLGYNKNSQKYYAVKLMKNSDSSSTMRVTKNEIGIMKNLNHPNIVNLIEFNEKGEYIKPNGTTKKIMYIVLELASGGELFEYVANTGRFEDDVCRSYYRQMLEALEYCHNKGICHRDMKPENVLYDDKYNLKLADFGFSTLIQGKKGDGKLGTTLGTESYMAPEIHLRMPYSGESVDLFATTIILFIMYAGTPPFTKADPKDPYYKLICNNKHETFWAAHSRHKPKPNFFTAEFKDFINKSLSLDPKNRLTIPQIKEHPWFNGKFASMDDISMEFAKRRDRVLKELEKERLKKLAEKEKKKQNQKNANYTFVGHGGFRSGLEIENDFDNLPALYPNLLNKNRKIQPKETDNKLADFFSAHNEDYLLKYVLSTAQKENYGNIILSDNKYKVHIVITGEEENLEFDIKISQVDEDVNCVEFVKKSGPIMDYYDKIHKIKEWLEELKKDDDKKDQDKKEETN